MSRRWSVRAVRRQVVRHLPPSVRALGRRARSASSSMRRAGHGPMLTVVVPVYNVEKYLDECLASLRAQTLKSMQIVVVDDGSRDGSAAVYERHAAEDSRIVVHRQPNAGLGAARNSGIRLATGRYLTFLDSDDTLPPSAYATMVRTLEASGSDFCIGSVRRLTRGRAAKRTTWIDAVHARDRIAITIDDFPAAVMDVICCNRMVRRSFWKSAGLSFPEGVAYEDHVPMMTAFLKATSFDILRQVTYLWRIRDDQSSIGQQKANLQNLKDRLHAKEVAGQLVLDHGSVAVREAWLGRVLDLDLWGFINEAEGADEEYWRELSVASRTYLDLAGPQVLSTVRVDRRVKTWLTAHGDRERVVEFIQAQRHEGAQLRTTVTDGVATAHLPFLDDDRVGVPRSMYEVSPRQSSLVTSLRSVSADDDGWDLGIWAYARYVDLEAADPTITAWVEDRRSGERIELAVEPAPTPEVTQWSGSKYQTYDRASVHVRVDASELVRRLPEHRDAGTWQLVVRLEVDGVVREEAVTHRDRGGRAEHLPGLPVAAVTVTPVMADEAGLAFRCRRPGIVLRDLAVDGRRLSGALELPARGGLNQVVATATTGAKVSARLQVDAQMVGRFELLLPEGGWTNESPDRRFWTLDVAVGAKRPARLAWPHGNRMEWLEPWEDEVGAPPELVVARTERGNVQVREVQFSPVVHDVELGDDEVVVRGRWLGPAPDSWSPRLSSHRTSVDPSRLTASGRSFEIAFPLVASQWGAASMPLPPADYLLLPGGTGPQAAPVRMALDLVTHVPLRRRTPHLRLELRRGGLNHLTLRVGAPLGDDEVGNRAQYLLQQSYREGEHTELPNAVLLQCYRGETATDSQLAIHHELRRRDGALELYWGVSDLSVGLPEGGIPLVIRSREWYRVLAGAKLLCNNIDFDRFFDKKPHQTFLQTFHGYPFKTMGISFWARQGSAAHVEHEVARRNAAWDILLTPSPDMNRYYREEYRYEGPILDQGYPRDDALVGPSTERTRRVTRRRLGIEDHQVVVMYAPTWRDSQATGAWSAQATNYLDHQRASEELGDDFVLLMRGHNYNARTTTRTPNTARVLDVTDYPEINDLVLASDAAVLDYSSLRFDFALTGKPMLFLVPDLEDYVGDGRGSLFPFEGTAPGPWLRTTDEVIGALRDLDAVQTAHLDEYEVFSRTYNRYHDGRASSRVVDALLGPAPA